MTYDHVIDELKQLIHVDEMLSRAHRIGYYKAYELKDFNKCEDYNDLYKEKMEHIEEVKKAISIIEGLSHDM